jgi:dipeptidase D
MDNHPVFRFFKELSAIPRASKNESAVADWIETLAKTWGLSYHRDELNNILVKKPASAGYESSAPVILQAHMDMVCEKTADSTHDFSKDPIELLEEDGLLKACGTTLGADNGIGLSYILAVLESTTLPPPPLEAHFTVDEEAGISGAAGFDMSQLSGRRLINLDSDAEGIFCVGCAGGTFAMMELPITRINSPAEAIAYTLSISGLKGGHSGIDINKGRANANILLARALAQLGNSVVGCAGIRGGSKDNAIPVQASADIMIAPEALAKANELLEGFCLIIRKEFADADPAIIFQLKPAANTFGQIMTTADFERLLAALLLSPCGMLYNRADAKSEANTSNNVAIVETSDRSINIHHFIRSNTNSRMTELADKLRRLGALIGASVHIKGCHPAWEHNSASSLAELCLDIYQKYSGAKAETETIHAGLECALFAAEMPELDILSFGPNLYDLHTVYERADIASVKRVGEYLNKLLEEMK